MRRAALLLVLVTGCSTAPVADLLDYFKPGRIDPEKTPPYGGVCQPSPIGAPAPAVPVIAPPALPGAPPPVAPISALGAPPGPAAGSPAGELPPPIWPDAVPTAISQPGNGSLPIPDLSR